MSKYEVSKLMEAQKLNPRTGIPLVGPPTTIPYGAILSHLETDGDYYLFTYLTERYRAKRDSMAGALHPIGGGHHAGVVQEGTPVAAQAQAQDPRPVLDFQALRVSGSAPLARARVPGGWLVSGASGALAYVPDPDNGWDGGSIS